MSARTTGSLLVLLAALSFATPARAQSVTTVLVDSIHVRPVLQRLWEESVRTNRERVACIGGERAGGVFRVTRAADLEEVLAAAGGSTAGTRAVESDSMGVSLDGSAASVATCAPPRWSGTVHTHRIERGVEHPRLSAGDRAVISLWHERWRRESVFCVLYSPVEPPACEWRPGA